jgi:hypothetical protein
MCQCKNYQIVFCAGTWRNAQVHFGEPPIGTNGLPKANCGLGQYTIRIIAFPYGVCSQWHTMANSLMSADHYIMMSWFRFSCGRRQATTNFLIVAKLPRFQRPSCATRLNYVFVKTVVTDAKGKTKRDAHSNVQFVFRGTTEGRSSTRSGQRPDS